MTTTTASFGLPNGRLLLGRPESADVVYRSAAASLASVDELAAAPTVMTWLDLRTPQEQAADNGPRLPDGWVVERVDAHPAGNLAIGTGNSLIAQLADGTVTFGQFYVKLIEHSSAELVRAVSVVARATGPVLVTCQIGRDRTGVLSALLLLVAGVSREDVVADYLRTNEALDVLAERLPALPRELDLTCLTRDIEQVLDHLDRLGGARAYLLDAGLPSGDLDLLHTRFAQ